ncbi:hypothetical protein NPX13_g5872 [Xylaria arbuscula]|uniref:Uncharacterized protein n=1 Tax=Xylaria arbuscula TaxID=114810 RepID=A0A9W8NDJ4_9PEZI|nr:hypothetical protein NPX13_g5872 [Xylaria arbuscula]
MSNEEHRELRRRADAAQHNKDSDAESDADTHTDTETTTEKPKATKTTEIIINAATVTDSANPVSTTTAAASPPAEPL